MNEILVLFNIICASASSTINVEACIKATEAATIQTGLLDKTKEFRLELVQKATDLTGITPTEGAIAYTSARYIKTKKLYYTFKAIQNTALTIQFSNQPNDIKGQIGITSHF